jgi:hypothetical protein
LKKTKINQMKKKILEKLKKKVYTIVPNINTKISRVKTIILLILAKLWHLATTQNVSKFFLDSVERVIFKLLWTEIERVKRTTLFERKKVDWGHPNSI